MVYPTTSVKLTISGGFLFSRRSGPHTSHHRSEECIWVWLRVFRYPMDQCLGIYPRLRDTCWYSVWRCLVRLATLVFWEETQACNGKVEDYHVVEDVPFTLLIRNKYLLASKIYEVWINLSSLEFAVSTW